MNCLQAGTLIEAFMDGELDVSQQSQVQAHLESCESCSASLKRLRQISDAIHAQPLKYEPDPGLQERVLKALRREANTAVFPSRRPYWMWMAIAACALLTMASAWLFLASRVGNREANLVAREVISSHVRSLMGNHLMDVPSTNQHTVKPWFNGKLDFSPNVKDLASGGFRLIGGRLDYIGGRPVAALVFQHNQHMINLFTWPANESTIKPSTGVAMNGYNSVHWSESGMSYWAVADIPVSALEDFARLYNR